MFTATSWAPAARRVLADPAVDGLAEQVSVSGVSAVLLDQVVHQPAQAGVLAVGSGYVNELVESTAGQGRVLPGWETCGEIRSQLVRLVL